MSEPFVGEIKAVGFYFAPYGYAFANGVLLQISQNQTLYALIGTNFGGDGRVSYALPNLQSRAPVGYYTGGSDPFDHYPIGYYAGFEYITLSGSQLPQHNHTATTTFNSAAIDVDVDTSGLSVETVLNAATGIPPTSRLSTPVNNVPTLPVVASGGAVNAYAAAGTGTPATLATGSNGAATSSLVGNITATGTISASGLATTVADAGSSGPVDIRSPFLAVNYIIALQGVFPQRN